LHALENFTLGGWGQIPIFDCGEVSCRVMPEFMY